MRSRSRALSASCSLLSYLRQMASDVICYKCADTLDQTGSEVFAHNRCSPALPVENHGQSALSVIT